MKHISYLSHILFKPNLVSYHRICISTTYNSKWLEQHRWHRLGMECLDCQLGYRCQGSKNEYKFYSVSVLISDHSRLSNSTDSKFELKFLCQLYTVPGFHPPPNQNMSENIQPATSLMERVRVHTPTLKIKEAKSFSPLGMIPTHY